MNEKQLRDKLRLYVIPDEVMGEGRSLLDQARFALRGGATAIQLRMKDAPGGAMFDVAMQMRVLCEEAGALFFVNDRLDVALAAGAHGVHLGQHDLPLEPARNLAPPGLLIGISAATEEEVRRAEAGGADYLGVGAVYATATKTDAGAIGLQRLREVRAWTDLPFVAIGGVTLDRAPEILQTGTDGLAVVSAIVGAPDIEAAAREFDDLISRHLPR